MMQGEGADRPGAVVVDRLPMVRVGLVTSLRLAGARTLEQTEDLGSGLEAAGRCRADLLVSGDVAGGAELLARHLPGLGTRVVLLVGALDRGMLVDLLAAGAAGVALRTVAPEDLAAMVRKVLAGERTVAPALVSVLAGVVSAPSAGPEIRPARLLEADGGRGWVELTPRERQVLARLAQGESNAAIAEAMFVSTATVKSHLARIYGKLDVSDRHEAMSRAVALGLVS